MTQTRADHWNVVPIKHLVRMVGGGTPSKDQPDFWNGDIPWVSPKDMKRWIVQDAQDQISSEAVASSRLPLIEPGAVLIVVRGMILAHSFPVALSGERMTINQDMKALIARPGVHSPFLAYALVGLRHLVFGAVDEAGHGTKALRMEPFGLIPVALPSFPKQQMIAAFLDRETAKIDGLIVRIAGADWQSTVDARQVGGMLGGLIERRTALITAAVTGQIDVTAPTLTEAAA